MRPQAVAATKANLLKVSRTRMDDALLAEQAQDAAARRASDEAKEVKMSLTPLGMMEVAVESVK